MLSVSRLSSGYGEAKVLHDVCFNVDAGEIVCLLGRNGAGKTSFLRALVGETPLSEGRRAVGETVRFGYYDQRGLQIAGREK